ncbi:unnamed protein product, partial [Effrenium voratum]
AALQCLCSLSSGRELDDLEANIARFAGDGWSAKVPDVSDRAGSLPAAASAA